VSAHLHVLSARLEFLVRRVKGERPPVVRRGGSKGPALRHASGGSEGRALRDRIGRRVQKGH